MARSKQQSRPKGRSGNPAKAAGLQRGGQRKATARDWIGGARLRTLTLGVVPVVLGTAVAFVDSGDPGDFGDYLTKDGHLAIAILALAVALFLQIGVNYSNDYSDGVRGTDEYRVGPARLTGAGIAKPRTVLTVALTFFGLAAVAGLVIVVLTGLWWILLVGAAAIVAAWFYTGGKRPYGYNALGEVFVFVFFGLVAVLGTQYTQIQQVTTSGWAAAVAAGFFACAVLMVNNIRDIDEDRAAGKRTLAVVLGRTVARTLYGLFLMLPYVVLLWFVLLYFRTGLTYFSLLLALPALVIGVSTRKPRELITALQLSSFASLAYGVVLGITLAVQP
ncbi:1,4-dihydroxy-2-naphthoate polyprenyltransferase [Curtobacterium sp. SP.BCp]|uniref:1,4-dihydroxy-2-naphthoate polyprenyltransferase n=1 Tax=unclassified Curtobacterium TaxID=257496 RepID=UPI0025B532FC|nr:1,4-dihydroxy-2-naphthoate polyprenyltransferase [Curtobacterium sp. 458]WJX98793.1 1,4-dihydroxy-2-naphthoate polyprenyltransferase [Curtobacterium sp. 458]